jgi:hypothetical protein
MRHQGHLWKRTQVVPGGKGMPLPTVFLSTVTIYPGRPLPKEYTREVRRQYSGEELRELRRERGVGMRKRRHDVS